MPASIESGKYAASQPNQPAMNNTDRPRTCAAVVEIWSNFTTTPSSRQTALPYGLGAPYHRLALARKRPSEG
ncbi:hypothetical protein GGTG_10805 [Gaeumannomyces tritici R3-111a-1]|uniref:Uncharacterized protein n=1 Tax=Gaeumannomyces tritici (strain R3-111a-1) TaxID=644352 RepID=J3PBD2_GAET3|nr:hypothetical protein GGTG_10805 [Gaeumannomyces tritici R3-111a-1]EJT71548.1 hypothetical protein GGTG_10805 [Gaeumannomyces tritici R3-111a-1]